MNSIKQRIEACITPFLPEMVEIRHKVHAFPELAFEEHKTSALVANLLKEWGYDVTTGIGKTGVVGTLRVGNGTKSIGIRADMDALPMKEETGLDYASTRKNIMHACGHDGHTTILLTAARYLAQTRNFSGTVHLIFQPAEEGFGGARAMIEDGLFEHFPCDTVFGLHNWPGFEAGHIYYRNGAIMAACDEAKIIVKGKGGHGATPHLTVDPIVTASAIVTALQSVVSRTVSPLENAVVTVGTFHAGTASNIIPETAELELTIRSLSSHVRDLLQEAITRIATEQAATYGATATVKYEKGYPVTINDQAATETIKDIAEQIFGKHQVKEGACRMGSEDFSYMLEKCPGSYIGLGNGPSQALHNPGYVFNDAIILAGATLWSALIEKQLVTE